MNDINALRYICSIVRHSGGISLCITHNRWALRRGIGTWQAWREVERAGGVGMLCASMRHNYCAINALRDAFHRLTCPQIESGPGA